MNFDPLHHTATAMTSLLSGLADIWPDLSADDGTGLLMPALAGVVAAMTVALMLAIYFQTGIRSYRDMIRHGLAAAIGLSLMAFVIYDMRNAAMAHLLKTTAGPTAQFELQWQKTTERARAITAEMDRNTRTSSEAHQG